MLQRPNQHRSQRWTVDVEGEIVQLPSDAPDKEQHNSALAFWAVVPHGRAREGPVTFRLTVSCDR